MKIKSLILSALLIPVSLFAATNSFDNVVISTSLKSLGTTEMGGTVTIGDAASDTIIWNSSTSTMIGGHNFNANTMFVTNGTVAFGTNATSLTAAVLIQQTVTNGAGFIVRGVGMPNATSMLQNWQTANSASVAGVFSNGVMFVGLSTWQQSGVNGVNNGGTVSFINNSAATSSMVNIGAGTGAGSLVKLSASGFTGLLTLGTNSLINSSINVQLTTNSTLMGPFLSVRANLIPGSIAANGNYSTNLVLANAVTNGAYMKVLPPLFEFVNLYYEVGCPSNGFVEIYIKNKDLVSAHTASNGTYGVTGIMPSL